MKNMIEKRREEMRETNQQEWKIKSQKTVKKKKKAIGNNL